MKSRLVLQTSKGGSAKDIKEKWDRVRFSTFEAATKCARAERLVIEGPVYRTAKRLRTGLDLNRLSLICS